MAGDIKAKYAAEGTYTITVNGLAGSSAFIAGRSSLAVDNTSALVLDYYVSGSIKWSTTAPAAGTYQMNVMAYSNIADTPAYVQDGSGNALGTDAAITFAQSSDVSNALQPVKILTLYATASKTYTFSMVPLGFGGPCAPPFHGLFVTHGVTTASSTPISDAATFFKYKPILAQYT